MFVRNKIECSASTIQLVLLILLVVKMYPTYATLLIVILLLFACQQPDVHNLAGESTVSNKYADGFEIEKSSRGYTMIVNRPWQQAENEEFIYSLSRNPDQNEIEIPVEKVVCMSTTHMAYLHALDQAESVAGLSGTDYLFNKHLQQAVKHGELEEVGFSENLNMEKIISLNPDVVFAYVIQPSELRPLRQLEKLDIPVVLVGDYLEQTPLAKLEWLRFFAAFYDLMPEADSLIRTKTNNYLQLKNKLPANKPAPKVLTNIPWQGVWWVPGGESYLAKLISDAGGQYIFGDFPGTESHAVDIEKVYQRSTDADVWINTGNANSYNAVFAADRRLESFHKLAEIRIFNNNKRSNGTGNDFYESAVVNPDYLLSDLIKIFHPEMLDNDTLIYYKALRE